jgi:NAD(P)-dependent dehydrogenase (short-subunit alcohol dehydrogenase family)
MIGRLLGKVAVVTGAASGIGAATVRAFVAQGAYVVIADVQDGAGQALAAELGDAAAYCRVDVTLETDVADAIAFARSRFGRFDGIVNNAGMIGGVGSIATMEAVHWRATMAILLDSVFFGVKHAAAVLLDQGHGGAILSTASIAALRGGFGAHPYTTAKHAIIGLTRSAAAELAPHGIRVNAVAPGFVVTPLSIGTFGGPANETARLSAESSPMKQPMFGEEIGKHSVKAADQAALR